jgi:hypothetical protein
MGSSALYFFAWLLPLFTGSGVWLALRGVRARGDAFAAIGAGWLVGVFLAAASARFAASGETRLAISHAWPWLAGAGIVAWAVAIARWRKASSPVWQTGAVTPLLVRVAITLLLAWIGLRFLTIGQEALLRPVFPWDAWSAWSTKPKTWFYVGHMEPYVSMTEWLSRANEALRTQSAWRYPELLAWIEIWFASGASAWNEPLVDVAWCGALAAFAFAAYGYWRANGLAPWLGVALVYALVSLPLVDAHVALAGYADLWLALTLGLVSLAWTRWLIRRDPGQGLLAVATALCLPMIKLEGMVWLLAFLGVVLLDLVPSQWRWRAALSLAALVVVGVLAAVGMGAIAISWGSITIPSLGTFALAWHGVGGAIAASLFTLPNWHLLWYAVPVLLVVQRRRFRVDRAARLLGLMLLVDFAFLFVLFFLTTASAWAQDFTSANRLILQLVPSVIVLAALLLRPIGEPATERARDRARATVPPIARA